jgi:hypothetical protein
MKASTSKLFRFASEEINTMFDCGEASAPTQSENAGHIAHIRICTDDHYNQGIAKLMTLQGGVRCLRASGLVYSFPNAGIRNDALQLTRSLMGWTVAEPFDVFRAPSVGVYGSY